MKKSNKRKLTGNLIVALIVACGVTLDASAQERRQPKQYQPPAQTANEPVLPNVIVSPEEDYAIGPSDVIEIAIEDAPELSRVFRVGADGAIEMPFLGRLAVAQKTAQSLSKIIADRLRGEYLNNPQVSVMVKQINSRTYFIQGAVRRPGLYQIEGRPSLLKLITIAGGLNDNYGSTAFIIHETKSQTTEISNVKAEASEDDANARYELMKVNINGLLRGNFDQNVEITPGDIIHIPPTDIFFVAGEVNAPGSFQLKEGTTLRQAISLAQGTNFQAAGSRGLIFREDPATGKRQEIKVDIPSVMSGKQEDLTIMANDIIIVPNSRLKSVGGTLLRAFGVNATRLPVRGY